MITTMMLQDQEETKVNEAKGEKKSEDTSSAKSSNASMKGSASGPESESSVASSSAHGSSGNASSATVGSLSVSSSANTSDLCPSCQQKIDATNCKRCSKCQEVTYCSERCEQEDWPNHYELCLQLSLANVAKCAACKHTMNRCPRCKKFWFCAGCREHFNKHQC